MKTKLFLTAALTIISAAAFAQDATDGKSSSVAVEKMICQRLYTHQPSADTNYQPGVDVNGKAVAPADVQTPFQATQTNYIEVPLQVNLANRLSVNSQDKEMYATLGNLRLYNDGRVLYNGQDLTQQAMVMCGQAPGVNAPANAAPAEPQPQHQQMLGARGRSLEAITAPDMPIPGSAAPSSNVTQ